MKDIAARLTALHRHLGHEPGKMTVLYGESTLIEVSLLLRESATEIRRLRAASLARTAKKKAKG